MAMELEFWVADGPNGEALDFAVPVAAWQILPTTERYRRPDHVMMVLKHTSRQRGEHVVWVRPSYASGTYPAVGLLTTGTTAP